MLLALLTVTAIATSSTGGNTAGSGGVVRTGDSYSSAHVRTVSGSDTTSVHIEVSSNGETKVVDRTFRQGEHASVSASVTSTTSPVRDSIPPNIVIPQAPQAAAAVLGSTTDATSSEPHVPEPGWGMRLVELIQNFFESIFGFLR